MTKSALDVLVSFVEGSLGPLDFQAELQENPSLEVLLLDDPDLPRHGYIDTNTFVYLLELDMDDPGDVLSAQGAVSEWLDRHSIAHTASKEPAQFYDLLLAAQPKWLDVDAKWLKDELVSKAEGRAGKELQKWLREELLSRFRYVSRPPSWIQGPAVWPIGAKGPLVFLGQLEIRDYFHDEAAAYVFYDPASDQCETIIQVA